MAIEHPAPDKPDRLETGRIAIFSVMETRVQAVPWHRFLERKGESYRRDKRDLLKHP